MKRFICILTVSFSVLVGTTATADPSQFKGEWSGTGVYQLDGVQTFCRTFVLKFDGNRYLMNFLGGGRVCDSHSETFAAVAMAHEGGKLYYAGQDVGSIEGNVLVSRFSMPERDGRVRHWRMSMRREGNTLVYEESRTMDDDQTPMISFAGVLTKK